MQDAAEIDRRTRNSNRGDFKKRKKEKEKPSWTAGQLHEASNASTWSSKSLLKASRRSSQQRITTAEGRIGLMIVGEKKRTHGRARKNGKREMDESGSA